MRWGPQRGLADPGAGPPGVGGAPPTPASLAIIEATFPRTGRPAIGAWSALTGVSGAVGPLLGGYLIGAVSWRAIFFINLPLGAFVVWAANRYVPETRDQQAGKELDFAGPCLAVLGLAGATFALVEAPTNAAAATVGVAAAVGLLALIGFALVEQRRPTLIKKRSTSFVAPVHEREPGHLSSSTGASAASSSFVAFLQVLLGYSPIRRGGGRSLLITALMLALSALLPGALAQRIGPRLQLTVGPLLIAVGMVLMSRIGVGDLYASPGCCSR